MSPGPNRRNQDFRTGGGDVDRSASDSFAIRSFVIGDVQDRLPGCPTIARVTGHLLTARPQRSDRYFLPVDRLSKAPMPCSDLRGTQTTFPSGTKGMQNNCRRPAVAAWIAKRSAYYHFFTRYWLTGDNVPDGESIPLEHNKHLLLHRYHTEMPTGGQVTGIQADWRVGEDREHWRTASFRSYSSLRNIR